jgi:hypothetical protein
MPAGDRKMPDPIVEPTSTAVALHNPRRRTSVCAAGAAPDSSGVGGWCDAVGGEMEALMIAGSYGSAGSSHAPPPLATTARGGGTSFSKMASVAAESLFWVAALVCVLAQLAIVRGVVVDSPRDGSQTPDAGPESARASLMKRRGRATEAAWALLPGIALALVLLWTWHTVRPAHRIPPQTNSQAIIAPAARA